jgi:hypothetical protein
MPGASAERWFDSEAGPVVRPYAVVGGRTRPAGGEIDLIAMITAARRARPDPASLEPEHLMLLQRCRTAVSVADLASETGLPVGALRVLLADLRERSLMMVHNPVKPSQLPGTQLLRRVADGLRRL